MTGECDRIYIVASGKNHKIEKGFSGNRIIFPEKKWQRLIDGSKNDTVKITICVNRAGEWTRYRPFSVFVGEDEIDEFLVYRNLMPGFQNWNQMGIYQRSLRSFKVKTVLDSRVMPGTCMNCHSFAGNDPVNMVMHLRENYGGTLLFRNDRLEKISTRTDKMFANAALPYWHTSAKYIAFSVNRINQIFHATGTNRASAVDLRSDIFVYDIERNEMITSPLLSAEEKLETFPCFSPDGRTLYFSSADMKELPGEYSKVRYSICSVSFDENSGTFGSVTDTLVSSFLTGKSYSIPRVSPDGGFMIFTVSDFGSFPSFNPESDLYLLDLGSKEYCSMDVINSDYTESYCSWSSDSRWVAFSSRRMDGLFMNIYFAFIDKNGNARKPFLLPQKDPDFHDSFLFSFNVPEFAVNKIGTNPYRIRRVARSKASVQVKPESSH
ncbi:MAG: hypothetical protein K0B05_09545 [Bacteroidales bacterium]|nr:hypothetical protein [Bacteroidales bacterium]